MLIDCMHIVFTPSGEYFAHIASKGPMQWTAPVTSLYKTSKWVVRICSIPDYVYIFESSYTITFFFLPIHGTYIYRRYSICKWNSEN